MSRGPGVGQREPDAAGPASAPPASAPPGSAPALHPPATPHRPPLPSPISIPSPGPLLPTDSSCSPQPPSPPPSPPLLLPQTLLVLPPTSLLPPHPPFSLSPTCPQAALPQCSPSGQFHPFRALKLGLLHLRVGQLGEGQGAGGGHHGGGDQGGGIDLWEQERGSAGGNFGARSAAQGSRVTGALPHWVSSSSVLLPSLVTVLRPFLGKGSRAVCTERPISL